MPLVTNSAPVKNAFRQIVQDPSLLHSELEVLHELWDNKYEKEEDLEDYLECIIILALSSDLADMNVYNMLTNFSNKIERDGFGEFKANLAQDVCETSQFIDEILKHRKSKEYKTLTHHGEPGLWSQRSHCLMAWSNAMLDGLEIEKRGTNVAMLMPYYHATK